VTQLLALRAQNAERAKKRLAKGGVTVSIAPGDDAGAKKYYGRIASKLKLSLLDAAGNLSPEANLDRLIEYAGFGGVTAIDLQDLESGLLMPQDASAFDALANKVQNKTSFLAQRKLTDFTDDKLLVSRFFAPKIVDYTQLLVATDTKHYTPGWRKLVRLRALPGSAASGQNVDSVYLLFNLVKSDVNVDPFDKNSSKNNQVIIVPKGVQADEDSAYFLVYGPMPQGQLALALKNVAFDLPAGPKEYFVPVSCSQCHGHDGFGGADGPEPPDGIYRKARVNYLDTDQWHDAIGFDFPQLVGTPWGVVFDGGTDLVSPKYAAAMAVLRKLNQGALDQVKAINNQDFKYRAAEKWVTLHDGHDQPVPFTERAIGQKLWDPSKPDETELLGLLDHYCFRCHSSLVYNVFDRDGVFAESGAFNFYLNEDSTSPLHMPQGRNLPDDVKNRILTLASQLQP
jgi:hypothetical protein